MMPEILRYIRADIESKIQATLSSMNETTDKEELLRLRGKYLAYIDCLKIVDDDWYFNQLVMMERLSNVDSDLQDKNE